MIVDFEEIGKNLDQKWKQRKARKSNKKLTLELIRKELEAADNPGYRAQLLEMERRVKHPIATKIDGNAVANGIVGVGLTLGLAHADKISVISKNVASTITDTVQGKFSKKDKNS